MKATCLTAALAALACGLAQGQVTPTQDGRALDANYGSGSGGYNSIRQSNRAFEGNLYITGQAGGGFFSFHGTAPYAGPNQLSLTVPSAGVDAFIRQSVGVDYASNPIYGPRVYLAPAQTVLGPLSIAGGQNAPGTSIPRTAYVRSSAVGPLSPMYDQMYQSAIRAYTPIMTSLGEQALSAALAPAGAGSPAGLAAPNLATQSGAVQPAASALFGVLRLQEQQRLARELTEAPAGEQGGEGASPGEVQPIRPVYPGQPVQPIQPGAGKRPGAGGREGQPAGEAPPPGQAGVLAPGQDVFLDVIQRLNQMKKEAPQPSAEVATPPPPRVRVRPAVPGQEEQEEQPPRPTPSVKPAEPKSNLLVLQSLAGRNRDMFNIHMSRAETLLRQGKYYDAAGEYQVAIILNRSNPLAWLGSGLALLAAYEPLSSAHHVEQALRLFPALMETRPDVKGLLGQAAVESRLEQLEKRLAEKDRPAEPSLFLLATFIRESVGDHREAVVHAGRLKALAGEDKLYQAYAEYVLTGSPPGTTTRPALPTTRPAAAAVR